MKHNKTKPSAKSAFDFINSIPNESRKNDGILVMEMMKGITNMDPVLWGPSIIGFGRYVKKYESGRETNLPLISFSPRKQQLVLYVLNNSNRQQELLKKLGAHSTGKVCLYIKKLANIDMSILRELITSSFNKAKKELG